MKYSYLFVVCILFVVIFLPRESDAAGLSIGRSGFSQQLVVEKTGVLKFPSDPSKALFSITLTLRAFGDDICIPGLATRKVSDTPVGSGGFEYAIMTTEPNIEAGGITYGAVMSTSTRVGGYYKIPKDERRSFTILALFDNSSSDEGKFRMMIDRIRFHPQKPESGAQSDDLSQRDHRTKSTKLSSKK